jgi:ATP/ADP translocase
MNEPKTLTESPWGQSWIEILVLYVLATVGSGLLLNSHWSVAMLLAPLVMLAFSLGVVLFVHTLWLLVIGLEKLGETCGLRKSPLA